MGVFELLHHSTTCLHVLYQQQCNDICLQVVLGLRLFTYPQKFANLLLILQHIVTFCTSTVPV